MLSVPSATATAKAVFSEFTEKNVTLMAAGIAYNAFVSLVPLLLLLLLTVTVLGGGLEERLVDIARRSLPGPIADVVVQVFNGDSAATGASFVGLVVLVWGSLKIFRGLDMAFSEIYGTESENTIADQLKDGVVVLVGLVLAGITTAVASAVFAVLSDTIPGIGFLTPLVLVFGLVLAFFPMYYLFPDVDLGWRQVVPGVVFSAVGWAALQSFFQVYLAFRGDGLANVFGGIVLVVTWLYFSGLVLLLGAVINAVISGHAPGAADEHEGRSQGRTLDRKETLDGDELAQYLRELREGVADRDGDGVSGPPSDAELAEYTATDGDEEERTVVLRWRRPADSGDAAND